MRSVKEIVTNPFHTSSTSFHCHFFDHLPHYIKINFEPKEELFTNDVTLFMNSLFTLPLAMKITFYLDPD